MSPGTLIPFVRRRGQLRPRHGDRAPEVEMPVLIVQSAGQKSYRIPLEDTTVQLGRSQKNQICLADDPSVSRYHAEISTKGDQTWYVSDLGSHNGTYVDDQPIESRMLLRPGDRIRVGRTTIIYTDSADTAEHEPTAPSSPFLDAPSIVVPVSEILSGTFSGTATAGRDRESSRGDATAHSRAFSALSRAAEVLLDQRPLDDVLEMALEMVFEVVTPERGAVLLLEGDPPDLRMRASRGVDAGQQVISSTIADTVVKKQQAVLTTNAQLDPRFMEAESIGFQSVNSALAVPLWNNKSVIGIIYTDSVHRPQRFTKTDLEALTLLANLVAVKIDNVRLFEREKQMRLLESELQNAAHIQKRLLPAAPPEIDGWEIFGFNEPCYDVGGDYYDFVERSSGKLAMALGDVSGKGMSAALLMATCQATFRAHTSTDATVETVVTRLNKAICESSEDDKFITFFYGELDRATGRLDFINAGHNPPMLFRAAGGMEELKTGGPILGFRANMVYRLQDVLIGPGDLLVTFSDGVTESQDAEREEFGEERLAAIVEPCRARPVAEIWETVYAEIKRFVGGAPQFDDLTLTLVKRSSSQAS